MAIRFGLQVVSRAARCVAALLLFDYIHYCIDLGGTGAALSDILRAKLHGRAALFKEEHLEILSEKRLNTEAVLPTATWADLVVPPLLPDTFIVELLQAFNVEQLREFGKSALASYTLFVMLLAVWAM